MDIGAFFRAAFASRYDDVDTWITVIGTVPEHIDYLGVDVLS